MQFFDYDLFRKVDRVFRSDAPASRKIAMAFGVGALLSLVVVLGLARQQQPGEAQPSSATIVIEMVVITGGVTVLTALFLVADKVRKRRASGEPVGLVARLLFGFGIWSLLMWLIPLTVGGFAIVIAIGVALTHR